MKIPISAEKVREQYLYPLYNMGIINMTRSVINRSENLYSPVEDSIFSLFDEDGDFRLKIMDYRAYPARNVIEEEFRTFVKQAAKEGVKNNNFFQRCKIVDADGTEMTISKLMEKYFSNPNSCFIKGYPEFNDNEGSADGDGNNGEIKKW